jgi:predicted AlkP superfamily pyrophosphatase or phosphodiesterase
MPPMHGRSFLWLGLAACLAATPASSQTAPAPPTLVLVLSVDQMRFDYLTRFDPLYVGGLRTLLDRGAVFTDAKYRHSSNETGPGHSVILTGRHPSHSGIVANDWFDRSLGKAVNVVDDARQRPLGGAGRKASPAHMAVDTVGDLLKARNPRSRVVAVSLKDRSAILMGGRRADAAYWYETSGGNFITSTYYMRDAPRWLTNWNQRRLANGYAGRMWTRLLPDANVYERYAGQDAIEGEWDRKDTVFPHAVRGRPPQARFYDDLRRTPFADDITLDFALEAMRAHQLGEDEEVDVFAIGFSATDVVGHTYGPESHEVMDQLLRLDATLGRLFKAIDSKVGLARTVVVLTSDHGVLPLVENLQSKGMEARRTTPAVLRRAVDEALAARFRGVRNLIQYFSAPDLYLNESTMRRHGLARKDVEEAAVKGLLATGLVAKVYTHDDLKQPGPSSDVYLHLFQNSFYEPRSPHLNILVKPWVYVSTFPGGTGHGTAYDHDRHVPIAFMGPQIRAGRYARPAGPEDIAPTLAAILGIPLQPETDARLLSEMLRAN